MAWAPCRVTGGMCLYPELYKKDCVGCPVEEM